MLTVQNEIGEAPLWVPEEETLYWTDTESSTVWSYAPATGLKSAWKLTMPATAIMKRQFGGFLLVTKTGLAFWDRETNTCEPVANPLAGTKNLWFNDGAVDRQGRLVTGTMNYRDLPSPDGSLYRLDCDRTTRLIDSGLSVANGITFSLDGGTMYVSEQFKGRILVYDYDTVSGTVSNRRTFVSIPEQEGLPDGLIVDGEGFLWNAHWGGGLITRYSPDGKIDLRIEMPVPIATCLAFGGRNLNELYITSGWYGMSAEDRKRNPISGDLFRVKTGIVGLVEPRFCG